MSEILIGRCGRTQEGQVRINKKSDFPLTLKLVKDGNFIKWYDCDFDIKAFVEDGFTTYTAGRSEGVFNHCRVEEDGTLTLFFDNHNLSAGELQIEVVFHHPDNDYGTDGVRQEAFTVATNILLVNDNGNAISLSIPEPKVVEKEVIKEVEKVVEVEVSRKENVNVFNVLGFDGFIESVSNLEAETATANYTILFDKQNKRFVALHEGSYSANWHIEQLDRTDEIYQTQGENVQPYANKIYIDKTDGVMYYWDGSNLSPLKVKPEDSAIDVSNLSTEITRIKERLVALENRREESANVNTGSSIPKINDAQLSSIINAIGTPNYVKIKSVENLINSGNILMGKGVHQNGQIISADLKSTDFIAVSKGDVIYIFVERETPNGTSILAIYDENKTLIESFGAHKKLSNDGVITIQKNGFIVLSAWKNNTFSAVRVVFEKQSITEELDSLKKDLSTFEKLSYNKAQGITGFLKLNGEVSSYGGFFTTPKIEVDGSKHRYIYLDGTALNASLTSSNYPIFMQFDSENNILSLNPSGVNAGEKFAKKEIALNPATKFVRGCCFGDAMAFYIKKIGVAQSNKKTINRNVNFVGMSIWWYDGKTTNNAEKALQVGYQSLLREQFNFKSDSGTNYCYSGFSLGGTTANDVNSIMSKSSEWKGENGDIWTLDSITNDFKRNIPIGAISDYENATGVTTFYGALRAFNDRIKALSGENAIVICSNSLRRNNDGYTSVSANSRGHKLTDYEFAIMTIAKRNNWYFVDQFRSGITDESLSITTLDGVHLNSFGYRLAVLPWIDVFNMVANAL